MRDKAVFSGVQLCEKLRPKQKCFRLQRYTEGRFDLLFHEHIPAHRMSTDSAVEAMRALVVQHEDLAASDTLRCFINRRGSDPEALRLLAVVVDYPERGVIRRYCGARDVNAWVDEVITPSSFRKEVSP